MSLRPLQAELKQSVPFRTLEQEAYLTIQRTADVLSRQLAEALRPHGLTPLQYNAVRILRGAGPPGMALSEIDRRMVVRDSDLAQSMRALAENEWVAACGGFGSEGTQGAQPAFRITERGTELMAQLDGLVLELHSLQFRYLSEATLRLVIDLLGDVRDHADVVVG